MCSGVFFSSARFPDFMQPVIAALPLTALIDSLRAVMIELKQDGPEKQVDHSSNVTAFAGDGGMPTLDNDRVTDWSYTRALRADSPTHRHTLDAVVVWMDGATPHAAFVARGTSHAEETIGSATRATIFELK